MKLNHLNLLAVALTLCASPAFATVIDIDFESDTPGLAPVVSTSPTNYITQPWGIGEYLDPGAASSTILVGSAPGMAQGVVLTSDASNGALGAAWLDVNGFNLISQQIRMSFDINVLAAPENATTQPKVLDGGPDNAGILLGMNAFTSLGGGFRFAAAPTSDGGGVFSFRTPDNSGLVSFFDYIEGQTYNVSIDADYTTGTLNASIDGIQLLTGYSFGAGASNVNTQEFFFHLNGEAGYSNSVALDNISATAIPEPTSMALCSIVGLGGAIAARRKKKQAAAAAAAAATTTV